MFQIRTRDRKLDEKLCNSRCYLNLKLYSFQKLAVAKSDAQKFGIINQLWGKKRDEMITV